MKFPWDKLGTLLAEVAVAAIGALLVDRVARPAPKPTPAPPTPRPLDDFPARADADITPRGHAGIDDRFRARPAPGANQAGPSAIPPVSPRDPAGANQPPPASLPGSALRGSIPPDPDPTEPDEIEPLGPRDMQ